MRIHLALQVGAHRLQLAHIGGDAGIARGRRRLHDVDDTALASHDDGRAPLEDAAVLAGLGRRLTLAAVEKIQSGLDGLLAVGGLDGAGIGGVDPCQAAIGRAHPDRLRHAGQQCGECGMIARELAELVLQRQRPGPLAADLAQADHGAAGDRPALGVDIAPGFGLEGEGEGLAMLLERLGREFEPFGFGRRRPGCRKPAPGQSRRCRENRCRPRPWGWPWAHPSSERPADPLRAGRRVALDDRASPPTRRRALPHVSSSASAREHKGSRWWWRRRRVRRESARGRQC